MKLLDEGVVPGIVIIYVVLKFQIFVAQFLPIAAVFILLGCNKSNEVACCCQSLIASGGCRLHIYVGCSI